ncbi:MAG: glycosyltransferase family 9 protein [Thermodesulfobacteriota bacterium]
MFSKINLLKTLDKFLGKFLSIILTKIIAPRKNKINQIDKILVIRPGGIGDAVLLLPSIALLKEYFPNATIYILAEKRNGEIFKFCPDISKLYLYDEIKKLDLCRLFKNRYDLVIDTEQWHTLSSIIAYLTKAPIRIGFDTNGRAKLFTHPVKYSQDDYEAESFLNLINEIIPEKAKFDTGKKFVFLKTENRFYSDEIEQLRSKSKFVAGLFYGATVAERKWGVLNYTKLANKLIDNGISVVLVGGESDLKEHEEFLHNIKTKSKIISFIGKTNLEVTANIISKTDFFISSDSGLMHLAYGLGVRTLSLFGAGIEKKWAPKGKNSFVINKKLFCSPCTKFGYTPKCPYNVRCLSEINVDEVYEKTAEVLGVRS